MVKNSSLATQVSTINLYCESNHVNLFMFQEHIVCVISQDPVSRVNPICFSIYQLLAHHSVPCNAPNMVFLADSAMLCRMVHSQATRNGEKDERKQPGTALHGDGSRYLVNYSMLVGGLEHFVFPIYGEQSSQLTHIFQRGRSTTNQQCYSVILQTYLQLFGCLCDIV